MSRFEVQDTKSGCGEIPTPARGRPYLKVWGFLDFIIDEPFPEFLLSKRDSQATAGQQTGECSQPHGNMHIRRKQGVHTHEEPPTGPQHTQDHHQDLQQAEPTRNKLDAIV